MASILAEFQHWIQIRDRIRDYFGYKSRWLWNLIYPGTLPSFGLWGLDEKLRSVIGRPGGYYIELGANNGYLQSNTLALELFFGWKGVLIEPIPEIYRELSRMRSRRRNSIFQAACVGFDFKGESLDMAVSLHTPFSSLLASTLGMDSTISDPRGHAWSKSTEDSRKIVTVPATTLNDLLIEAKSPSRIDLLSLDVEGGELEVLRGLDFSAFLVQWMLIETREFGRVAGFLEGKGYALHSSLSHHDYLFELKQS